MELKLRTPLRGWWLEYMSDVRTLFIGEAELLPCASAVLTPPCPRDSALGQVSSPFTGVIKAQGSNLLGGFKIDLWGVAVELWS